MIAMKYITLIVLHEDSLIILNEYYADGWEFVNSVAQFYNGGAFCPIYYTLRKPK